MNDIEERPDKVRELFDDKDFLEGKGLNNGADICIFCYDPEDEMAVRHFVQQVKTDRSLPCRVMEQNLYQIIPVKLPPHS